MKTLTAASYLIILLSLTACGEKEVAPTGAPSSDAEPPPAKVEPPPAKIETPSPVTTSIKISPYGPIPTPMLDVTSVVDEVSILSVSINRGNCQANHMDRFPIVLKFGQTTSFSSNPACKIIEAVLSTNKGEFIFTFQRVD